MSASRLIYMRGDEFSITGGIQGEVMLQERVTAPFSMESLWLNETQGLLNNSFSGYLPWTLWNISLGSWRLRSVRVRLPASKSPHTCVSSHFCWPTTLPGSLAFQRPMSPLLIISSRVAIGLPGLSRPLSRWRELQYMPWQKEKDIKNRPQVSQTRVKLAPKVF